MATTITQKVIFKNSTPEDLYDFYLNAEKHAGITGAPAAIGDKAGSKFSVYGNYATGKNIHLVKNRMIVQTWRAEDWNDDDLDSIFSILLERKNRDTILSLVHAYLPDSAAADIDKGWHEHYWDKWKQYLKERPGF